MMIEVQRLTLKLLMLSWITAKRQLIHNRTASRNDWNDKYDFIVVGAGAAGCVVANRLAESNKVTVLLLEVGGAQNAIYNDIPALFMRITDERPDLQTMQYTEPQKFAAKAYPGGCVLQSVGKTLGGSSAHNNMIFNRGNPKDYDLWEHKYGAKGWNFREILPFFRRFENNTDQKILKMSPGQHGTSGPVQVTTPRDPGENLLKLKSVYNSLGFMDTDINSPQQTGAMIGQSFITGDGLRSSSSNSYIDPNPYPKSLHIVTKAMVNKILFNGLTAVGVEFAKNDKPFRVFAQKEVIISAGAVNAPQILMLSGIGPRAHLNRFRIPLILDLPVGSNYKNHMGFNNTTPIGPPLTGHNLHRLYHSKSGPLSQHAFIGLFFSTKSNPNKKWPNIFVWSVLDNNGKIKHIPALGLVRSKGTVRLQSTSPYIQPLIDPNFYSDRRDYTAAIEAMTFIFRVSGHPSLSSNTSYPTIASVGCLTCPGLKDFQCIEGIKCFLQRSSTTLNHPSGTCRMGDVNSNDVVVDPYLRVKNAKNLRVCDASIMPDIPNGNLYAPALMIGEKCAQIIKDYYKV